MSLKSLYQDHVGQLQARVEQILGTLELEMLVIDAGAPVLFWEDDRERSFCSNHHFRYWCPIEGPHHLLVIQVGKKPRLKAFIPRDFWYENKQLTADFWTDSFTIEIVADVESLWQGLPGSQRAAYVGPEAAMAIGKGFHVDPPGLKARLNWERIRKTSYEQQCLVDATRVAASGHRAAERSFRQGGSELDIHLAYLSATRQREADLPYDSIIALDEKAAFLHYSEKRDDVHNGRGLLIDAGASVRGYGSDITRSYATEDTPEEFQAILADMGRLQQGLCAQLKVGMLMSEVHAATHKLITQLLLDHRILINCSAEQASSQRISSVFFPHGIGHLLGIFVHDVGGYQLNAEGDLAPRDPMHPFLRTIQALEPGTCVTIEPGLYFIKMLLDPFRAGAHKHYFNWALIDQLMPCGGIRIEDNIIVQNNAIRNVTREFLP